MMDASTEDQGEFYDNEKEGGDIRNEQSFKRCGSETETGDAETTKKPKMEVLVLIAKYLAIYTAEFFSSVLSKLRERAIRKGRNEVLASGVVKLSLNSGLLVLCFASGMKQ
ncbi:unnamed protein product [Brugia timori]|uniref:CBFD_NFYB_HMF domain-containing protein n=1 Tax=Brugia timori TaxID=42155 RepID=A0A0R3QTN8_9BILA|nr:unnamed protein product [Brugia timori]